LKKYKNVEENVKKRELRSQDIENSLAIYDMRNTRYDLMTPCNGDLEIYDLRFACLTREIRVNPMIDPSAVLRTPVRAGPNGVDRVLVDK
jgi:hypothetical protein